MLPFEEPSFAIGREADGVRIDAFTQAHDKDQRIEEYRAANLSYERHHNKVRRRQIEDVTQWEKKVETGYFNRFRKRLSRSTCRSAVHSPRSSEDSYHSDKDDPLEKSRTRFYSATTGLPTTNPNDGSLSSHGYREFLSGSDHNAGTIRA
jgi:hypothetical protein